MFWEPLAIEPEKEEGEEVVRESSFIHLMHIYLVLWLKDIGGIVKWSVFL